MRRTAVAGFLVLMAVAVFAPVGLAKRGDGIPSWVAVRERQASARLFGANQPLAETFHIAETHKIVVVFEFQNVVTCRTCSEHLGHRPYGRVARIAFDRKTQRLLATIRFCEIKGTSPPLGACLAR